MLLATDGRVSHEDMREAASLAADAMQESTVVVLMSAPRASTFEQLGLSTGSVVDVVRSR